MRPSMNNQEEQSLENHESCTNNTSEQHTENALPIEDIVDNTNEGPTLNTQRTIHRGIDYTRRDILVRLVHERGLSIKSAAASAGINYNSARSIIMRYNHSGELTSDKRGGARGIVLTNRVLARIEHYIEENPAATLIQLQHKLREEGINISKSSVENALAHLEITLKKSRRELARVNEPATIEARKRFALEFAANAPQDRAKCIYIDECGFNLHLTRSQARSRRGTRARVVVPTVRGRNVTLISAMSTAGILHSKIIDDGNVNGDKFLMFMRELKDVLVNRGDMSNAMILMDNARIHNRTNIESILSGTGFHLKFLSPYSYMINPIELVFSKIKTAVRRILCDARANEATQNERSLKDIIIEGIATVTPTDCTGFFDRIQRNMTLAAAGTRFIE